jgi:hypothetical protein
MPVNVKTPGMVTFVAVLMFIAGSFNIIGCACGGGSLATLELVKMPQAPGQPDPMALPNFLKNEVPGYLPVLFALLGLDGILGVVKIILGIGILRLNSMARLATMLVYIVNLLLSSLAAFTMGSLCCRHKGVFLPRIPCPDKILRSNSESQR